MLPMQLVTTNRCDRAANSVAARGGQPRKASGLILEPARDFIGQMICLPLNAEQ